MRYTKGSLGRVFVARLEDGESIYDAVEEIAHAEDVRCGVVLAVGGIRWAKVVTGPEIPHGKVTPHVEQFDDARELVGVGTLFPQDGKPSLHFHAGIGRGTSALVGCPRVGMGAYLVLEVIVIEMLRVEASRVLDAASGVHLLRLGATPSEEA